jgi:hypothetical protein
MKRTQDGITRRDFLHSAAELTVAAAAGGTVFFRTAHGAQAQAATGKRAKVVLVRDRDVVKKDRELDSAIVSRMLDDAVTALLGEAEAPAAWKSLISPTDVVGIKSNAWRFLPTPRELETAIRRRVIAAGVGPARVDSDDRGVLRNPVFRQATALINVRPLRTHHWAGVGSCIKNYIMFSPDPPSWHADACANLAGLWDLPAVKGKTRLNILVMLTPLFHGKGPHHFQARYIWQYRGLLVGTDPVAVDATGVRILEAKRREFFGENQPFAVSPKHIRVAEEKYGLGVADPARIEVQKIGWDEGVLI